MKTDYANAGVPMLPVVAGERVTRAQIGLYTIPMAIAAVAPWPLGLADRPAAMPPMQTARREPTRRRQAHYLFHAPAARARCFAPESGAGEPLRICATHARPPSHPRPQSWRTATPLS